jgi:hypothetical protein
MKGQVEAMREASGVKGTFTYALLLLFPHRDV